MLAVHVILGNNAHSDVILGVLRQTEKKGHVPGKYAIRSIASVCSTVVLEAWYAGTPADEF